MSVSGELGKCDVPPGRRLEELLDGMPKSWQPWVGACLVGQAVQYEPAEGACGSSWLCVVEEPETGDLVTIFLSANVLRDEFKSEKPTPGETIGQQGHRQFRLIVVGRAPPGEPPMAFSGEVPVSQADLPF